MRLSTKSHNLHLRAALARGDAAAALRHFEAMSAAHPPQGLAPAAPAPTPAPAPAWVGWPDAPGDAAATPAAAASAAEGAVLASGASGGAWWLGEPARPDAHSYSIALTALRVAAPSDAPQEEHVERARRAAALARAAVARGGGAGGQLSAPLVHSLIASCGGDVRTALALWRLPMVSGGAEAGLGAEAGAGAEVGAEAEAEAEARRAGLHALLRVCGVGGRADQALRVVTAARREGSAPDASFWTAYVNGRAAADAAARDGTSYRRLLQSGYERLLQVECCPEQVGGKLGKVERIRIRF